MRLPPEGNRNAVAAINGAAACREVFAAADKK